MSTSTGDGRNGSNAAGDDHEQSEWERAGHTIQKIPHILPHERVFPIQIGTELFKLSGASLSSDAPSYFSQYFLCQIRTAEERGEELSTMRTLYIDRDPETFRDISLHLQGYHVSPRDGTHFVRLFADAQFYSLPKLVSQLFEESIFINIGHREFQIPRDIFSDPGNSPNYFSLGFGALMTPPDHIFPGLHREGLIRPPSILPPSVPNRSAETFAELLRLLRGYPVNIRDETHRAELLRDARYFHFKGLEQKLVPHRICFNQIRGRNEIVLRLENVQKSGISVLSETGAAAGGAPAMSPSPPPASSVSYVGYARPFVDDTPAELVLELGGEATKIHFSSSSSSAPGISGSSPRAQFFNDTLTRIARLFEVIAAKLNLPPTTQPLGLLMASGGAGSQPATPGNTPLSEDFVRVAFEAESAIILDGKEYTGVQSSPEGVYAAGDDGLEGFRGESTFSAGGDSGMSSPTAALLSSTPAADSSLPRKRRRLADGSGGVVVGSPGEKWTVKTGQWRLRIQPGTGGKRAVECVLVAVKIDAVSSELARNNAREFLM